MGGWLEGAAQGFAQERAEGWAWGRAYLAVDDADDGGGDRDNKIKTTISFEKSSSGDDRKAERWQRHRGGETTRRRTTTTTTTTTMTTTQQSNSALRSGGVGRGCVPGGRHGGSAIPSFFEGEKSMER